MAIFTSVPAWDANSIIVSVSLTPYSQAWTLAQRALLRTAQEVAKGLAYVHSLGIVHADLKPANVLLQTHRGLDRRGYTARLADFGAFLAASAPNPAKYSLKAVHFDLRNQIAQ